MSKDNDFTVDPDTSMHLVFDCQNREENSVQEQRDFHRPLPSHVAGRVDNLGYDSFNIVGPAYNWEALGTAPTSPEGPSTLR